MFFLYFEMLYWVNAFILAIDIVNVMYFIGLLFICRKVHIELVVLLLWFFLKRV